MRDGRVRLHDPATGVSIVILDLRANTYTNSEDGMYGPAVDTGRSPIRPAGPHPRTTPTDGGMYQRPTGDDRRTTLNTNDLRGKMLRIKVKDAITAADQNRADLPGSGGGAYTIPAGNLYPLVAGAPQARTRPEVYAMGFRNPFRLSVDENDVAYTTDYSPDANTPARSRGPAGVGRVEIVRHPANYGYPLCYSSKLGYYRWNFQEFAAGTTTVGTPLDTPAQPVDCAGASLVNDSRWVANGGPGFEPGLRNTPRVTDPEIWYSYRDNTPAAPLGTPCFGYYATTPGSIAPGSTTECPRLFPELFTGGVGPQGISKYHYEPGNPSTTKFPPYFDESVIFGEFTQDTMREVKLDSQNRVFKINSFLPCGQANVATTFAFECDNPMDMQWGADGSLYLLTYGDGFFTPNADAGLYKFNYVKGQRAPRAVLSADRTNGPAPLTVKFSSAGSNTPEPSESITYSWDFGDGTPVSLDPNPTHTYTAARKYTVVLTVTSSSGKTDRASATITAGNTAPTLTVQTPPAGGTFAFGDTIPYTVTGADPEDGTFDCNRVVVTFVLGHDTHGHAEEESRGCQGVLNTDATDVAHGGNVFGVVSATYTDRGGDLALSTTAQQTIRQKRQEVEVAVNQSGTNTAATTDVGGGTHRGSLAAGDWIQLNGPFNLVNITSITTAWRTRPRVAPPARRWRRSRSTRTPSQDRSCRRTTWSRPVATPPGRARRSRSPCRARTSCSSCSATVPDGATGGNLFNLNWTEFVGKGIAQ